MFRHATKWTAVAMLVTLVGTSTAQARPYFGIGLVENWRRGGLQIVEIVRGGPVDEANRAELWATGKVLLDNVDLIVAVDGYPVRTHTDMFNAVNRLTPGAPVRMDCRDRFDTPFYVFITPQGGGVITYMKGSGHPSAGGGSGSSGGSIPPAQPYPSGPGRPGMPSGPGRP